MEFEDVKAPLSGDSVGRAPGGTGFFGRLFSFILGGNDPEREKRRLLKVIAKDLRKSRSKFFQPRGDLVLPNLGKFFFDVYRVVGPAQALLQNADSSGALRQIVIEGHLTPEQLKLMEAFSEAAIREKAQTIDTRKLAADLKDALVNYFAAFDHETVKRINHTYNLLLTLVAFVNYDFYFLLKKFDSTMREKDFAATPKFEPINGEYISDDLKDFLEVALPIDKTSHWDNLFDLIAEYRSVDIVSRPAWKKLLGTLDDVRKSGVLEQIVRYVDKNPFWKPIIKVSAERIVEPYLGKLKTQTELTFQKILQERKNQKIEKLCQLVFGQTVVARMKNYTDRANAVFSKRMLGGYAHTAPANYLKAFLIDYAKKDMRELRDLLIVRGKWSTNFMSQQLSETFHQVMLASEELLKLDEACADEGEFGQRIKKHIARADRDQASMKLLKEVLKDVNDKTGHLISESGQNLMSFGKSLKVLVEDYDKAPASEVIINWKEVDNAADGRIKSRLSEVYKRIYYFIQLLQLFGKAKD